MNRRLLVGRCRRLRTPRLAQLDRAALHRRESLAAKAVFVSMALLALFVLPIAVNAADLSRDIRTADDASPYKSVIDQYIQSQVAIIQQDDPKASSQARDSLVDEVRGLTPPSASFLDTYCTELRSQLASVTPAKDSIRVRLNAAIVVAKVATTAQDAGLAPLVISELSDPNEAVVLWGLKAAHDIIPSALNVQALKSKLITAVNGAAQRLGTGMIVAGAYDALATSDNAVAPQGLASLIVPIQNLLAWRLQQYANGVPPEPPADARATAFLTQRRVWLADQQQHKASAQLIVNLIAAALTSQTTAQPDDRDQLTLLLRKTGEAIYVIGINEGDQALEASVTPLTKVDQRPPPMPAFQAASLAVSGLAAKFPGLLIPKPFGNAAAKPVPTSLAPAASPAANSAP